MNFLGKLIGLLGAGCEAPKVFGVYHFICLAAVIGATVFVCRSRKFADDKGLRRLLTVAWIVMVAFEVYKQIVFSFSYDGTSINADYQWYAFPFQFCSMPLYVLPFAAFLKEGRLRDSFLAFISTYLLFAGAVVMIYPGDVFCYYLGINFQTMLHHGLQVVLGSAVAAYLFRNNKKPLLGSLLLFSVVVVLAMLLNVCAYHLLTAAGNTETFNMFFVSPYFDCTLPVLSIFYPILPYPIFLLVYVVGFSLAAYVVYLLEVLISRLVKRCKND